MVASHDVHPLPQQPAHWLLVKGDHRHLVLHRLRPVVDIVVTDHAIGCFVCSLVVLVPSSSHFGRVACLAMINGTPTSPWPCLLPSNLLKVWLFATAWPSCCAHKALLVVAGSSQVVFANYCSYSYPGFLLPPVLTLPVSGSIFWPSASLMLCYHLIPTPKYALDQFFSEFLVIP